MKNAYTLIEVITTITIFLLISGSITGLFLSSIAAQRRALASQMIFDNMSYALEYMSRALRMAKKDINDECLNLMTPKYNYSTSTPGVTGIRFINYHFKCQEFYLKNDGRIYQRISSSTSSANFTPEIALTPSNFKISTTTSKFEVFGANQTDNFQPRVIIFLDVQTKGAKPESRVKIQIQTTISQRDLDVQE